MRKTARGRRKHLFKDSHGRSCSVQESSSSRSALWFGVCTSRMHLTQELAAQLLPLVQHFVDTGKLPDVEVEVEEP